MTYLLSYSATAFSKVFTAWSHKSIKSRNPLFKTSIAFPLKTSIRRTIFTSEGWFIEYPQNFTSSLKIIQIYYLLI